MYSSFRVNHVREKKSAKKRGSKFEYWDKTSWLNFTIESNFRPWIISKLLRSWKQAFFIIVWPINVCFMVIVNWLLKISLNAGNWTSVLLLFFFLSFPNRVLYLEINPFPGLREIYSFFENFIFFGVSRRLGNTVKKKKKWNFREKHSVKIFSRKTREYTRKIHSLLSLRIIYRRINRTQGGINRPSLW